MKILVVDDDENMRDLLRLHLGNAGHKVRSAEDGVVAGYAVLTDRPDLIITDVSMPHLDGFEFVAALRADPDFRDIPVIFLSTAVEGEQRGRELGALAFIPKPVRADWLLRFIATNVGERLAAAA
jgi:CheY-like chemotaxis protein